MQHAVLLDHLVGIVEEDGSGVAAGLARLASGAQPMRSASETIIPSGPRT
jgi:hypothetical protein